MNDNEIMTLEKAMFILRHGSAEGLHKYLEAIDIIEKEINRQKATIEGLQRRIVFWKEDLNYNPKKERSEAIKEFAERLKNELSFGRYIQPDQIDNLAKEMTGETEGK